MKPTTKWMPVLFLLFPLFAFSGTELKCRDGLKEVAPTLISKDAVAERLAQFSSHLCSVGCWTTCAETAIPKSWVSELRACKSSKPESCTPLLQKMEMYAGKKVDLESVYVMYDLCLLKGGEFCDRFFEKESKGRVFKVPYHREEYQYPGAHLFINAAIIGCSTGAKKICGIADRAVQSKIQDSFQACLAGNDCRLYFGAASQLISAKELQSGIAKLKKVYCGLSPEKIVKKCAGRRRCEFNSTGTIESICGKSEAKALQAQSMGGLVKAQLGGLYTAARAYQVEWSKTNLDFNEIGYQPNCQESVLIEAVPCEPMKKNLKPVLNTEQYCQKKKTPLKVASACFKTFEHIRPVHKPECSSDSEAFLLIGIECNAKNYEVWTLNHRKVITKIKEGSL